MFERDVKHWLLVYMISMLKWGVTGQNIRKHNSYLPQSRALKFQTYLELLNIFRNQIKTYWGWKLYELKCRRFKQCRWRCWIRCKSWHKGSVEIKIETILGPEETKAVPKILILRRWKVIWVCYSAGGSRNVVQEQTREKMFCFRSFGSNTSTHFALLSFCHVS